jgi:hypothetical protein
MARTYIARDAISPLRRKAGASLLRRLQSAGTLRFCWRLTEFLAAVVDFAAIQARSTGMDHLSATLEELLIEAERCALISRLATDLSTRVLFDTLARDVRSMVRELEVMILARAPVIF